MTEEKVTKRLEKKNAELQRIRDARARWWKKLMRAANAIEKLNDEEKRLLKPRKLEPHEALKITSEEWTKIREREFDDLGAVFVDMNQRNRSDPINP